MRPDPLPTLLLVPAAAGTPASRLCVVLPGATPAAEDWRGFLLSCRGVGALSLQLLAPPPLVNLSPADSCTAYTGEWACARGGGRGAEGDCGGAGA